MMSSCASPQVWSLHSITAGDALFDTSRLRYHSPQGYSNISFEMVRLGSQIESYLSLTRFRFPPHKEVKIRLEIEGQPFEEEGRVHAGGMRLRLSPELTQKIIGALQADQKVVILVDDFEETLVPGQFSATYAKFENGGNFFENILKGLMR